MSDLSVFLHKAAAFFSAATSGSAPADQAMVSTAAAKLQDAGQALDAALPVIAKGAADTALLALGPVAIAFEPAVNSFIDALIAELQGRKTQPGA